VSTPWYLLFSAVVYLSAALCIVAVVRHWKRHGPAFALCELFTFLLFVVIYWLFESWATYILPYYKYGVFWDRVPFFDWSIFSGQPWLPAPYFDPICKIWPDQKDGISLSVPVMEAALTYAAMWTARLLAPTLPLLQPFVVGLAMLAIDLFLDPVSATRFDCQYNVSLGAGLGFWGWQVHAELGLRWFGIPLFNFAAWHAAPIAAVALALLLKWLCDYIRWVRAGQPPGEEPDSIDGALRGIIFFAYTFLFAFAPTTSTTVAAKELLMFVTVLGSLYAAYVHRSYFVRNNAWRLELVLPPLLVYGFALVALLLSGLVTPLLPILLAGLFLTALGVYYAVSPYM
jgi:hypothetical protein